MAPSPRLILEHLLTTPPMRLDEIETRSPGVYALYDHEGRPSYIGMTTDLRHRICNNHPSGDGNSHKFSTVYNAGRMFHSRKDPRSCPIDGKVAKSLRTLFAREYCRAVPFELPGYAKADLATVEDELRHMAPADTTRWNDLKALPSIEPSDLVAALLARLSWGAPQIAAIERQAARWSNRP